MVQGYSTWGYISLHTLNKGSLGTCQVPQTEALMDMLCPDGQYPMQFGA